MKIQYAGNAIWSFPAYQNWIWLSQSVWNIVWNFLETNSYILRTQADRQSPFDRGVRSKTCVNALSGLYLISTQISFISFGGIAIQCQCPLGLIPHFYKGLLSEDYRIASDLVSMPSRAYTSFLRYPFKNLGFMRFPEPVFAGIYQNILTTAVFRAC